MSITSIKKPNSFNFDCDSLRSLDYMNFKMLYMLYPNDLIKSLMINLTVATTVSKSFEIYYSNKTKSVFSNRYNFPSFFIRNLFECTGYPLKYNSFLSQKNRIKILNYNFYLGFLIGGYLGLADLWNIRTANLRNERIWNNKKISDILICFRQCQYSMISAGLTIGYFWGLYFYLSTFINRGDEIEYFLKKVSIGIFSAYYGFLFQSYFYLFNFAHNYKYYTLYQSKIDFMSISNHNKILSNNFNDYLLIQKNLASYIIYHGLTISILDYLNLI